MPAIAATAENLDHRPVLILCQWGNGHRLCFTETGQGDAGKKRNGQKLTHEHSPILRLERMMIPAIGPSCSVGLNWVVHARRLVHALTHL
jgi:hypothetical protein